MKKPNDYCKFCFRKYKEADVGIFDTIGWFCSEKHYEEYKTSHKHIPTGFDELPIKNNKNHWSDWFCQKECVICGWQTQSQNILDTAREHFKKTHPQTFKKVNAL